MGISTADKNFGRQYVLSATQTIDYTDLANGSAEVVLDVRPGTRVVGGFLLVDTVWDGTTPTLDLGDGIDPDRYTATPVDLATAGVTALDVTGYKYVESDTIDGTLVVTGTPTQGSATLVIQYIIDGRSNEVEPNYS
jgi:hypothetical protein